MLLSEGNFATSRAYIDSNWVDGGINVEDYKLTSYSESSGDQGMAIPGFVDLQVNGHDGIDLLKAKDVAEIKKNISFFI